MKQVPIGVSARHIHLSSEHIDQLFGNGYQLKIRKELSQPGQFAAEETVRISGPRGRMEQIRIIGPPRKKTQLELSRTDTLTLGITVPLRESGNIEGTPGIFIEGPNGNVMLNQGVIVAARHIHFHPDDASRWGIRDRQMLVVKLNGERPLIFENVTARVSPTYMLNMHIDTDEANAAGVKTGDIGIIL